MQSSPQLPNNQPNSSLRPRVGLAPSHGALATAPFEEWFPVAHAEVDLACFEDALNCLEQTSLRGDIFEARGELKKGLRQVTAEGTDLALERFNQLAPATQKELVQGLFFERQHAPLRSPISNYTDCVKDQECWEQAPQTVWLDAGRSILSEGVLPAPRVRESLTMNQLTLNMNAASPNQFERRALLMAGFAGVYLFAPPPITAICATLIAISSVRNYQDARIAREAIRGYSLESLDTYETIRSGKIRDIGQALNEHFGDPQKEHYQKLWRASGFAVARMLRVFGNTPDEIFSLFLNSPCIHLNSNPTVERTRQHFVEHGVPNPASMIEPFIEDGTEGESVNPTEKLVSVLNEVYFTRVICESEKVRYDLARRIFQTPMA